MLMTRRRWDVNCLAITVFLAGVSAVMLWSGIPANRQITFAPAWGLMFWTMRFGIPPSGYRPRRIRELEPAAQKLIACVAAYPAVLITWLVARLFTSIPDGLIIGLSIVFMAITFTLACRVDASRRLNP